MTAYAITLEVPDRGGQGQAASLQDLDAIAVAADTSMEIPNDGDIVAFIRNANAGAVTAVVKAVPDPYGRGGSGVGDVSYTIPAGGGATPQFALIPLMNPAMFNNVGITQITLSTASSVTVAFIRLKKVR